MTRQKSIIFLVLTGLLLSLPALAAVYMEKDADGNVVFTDRPDSAQAKPVEISPPSIYTAPDLPPPVHKTPPPKAVTTRYEYLRITSPADDEPIRANNGRLTVSIRISPRLNAEHLLELLMDGKKVAETQGDRFELAEVDRGTHSLQVQVVDAKGRTLISSKPSSFHLLRYAIPHSRPR